MAVLILHRMRILRVTQCGNFTYNTEWQFYV